MHLAIARDYFPRYARLPRKAQVKADEFLRRFLAEPNTSSMHLEMVRGARDKQFRTARIGDDYRVILRAPERGDTFVLMWIAENAEAERWARAKCTEIHPATGTLQLFDADAVDRAFTGNVFRQADGTAPAPAKLFDSCSDEDLFRCGVPRILIPAVRAIASENELELLAPHLPREAAEVLTGLAAGFTLETLREEVLGEGLVHSPTSTTVDPTDVVAALERPASQQQFRTVGADFDMDMALTHPLDVWRVFLHPKQRMLARSRTKGPMRVTGGAGTGKTVVALHRVAFLVREVYTRPDDRVLFTTFTVNLALDLKRQLEKLLEPYELARVDVRNIDGLAFEILRKKGVYVRLATDELQAQAWQRVVDVYGIAGYGKEFCETEWRDVVQSQNLRDEEAYVRAVRVARGIPLGRRERRQLWQVFDAYRQEIQSNGFLEPVDVLRRAREAVEADGGTGWYRAVVVDEAQDFSLEALRLVRAFAGQEHPDDLFLVGDAHQRIYGRPVALTNAGIHVRGRRSQHLRLNYRTTGAICRWSLGALGQDPVDDLDDGIANRQGYVSLREGRAPFAGTFQHAADEETFVVREIKKLLAEGASPETICIVARSGRSLRDRFLEVLHQEGISADIVDRDEPRHPSVRLATMHRVKGLEFPVVFVVGVNAGEVPQSNSGIFSEDPVVAHRAEVAERCLLYVAASRARDALYVTSFGDPSPFLAAMGVPPVSVQPREPEPVVAEDEMVSPDQLASVDVEAREPDNKATAGGTPLTSLELPTRIYSWAEKKGITTVEELLRMQPRELLSERNLGRKTIAETREVIAATLGRRWEDAVPTATSPMADDGGFASKNWDVVRRHLPAELAATNLEDIDLPVRILTYAQREGLVRVDELAKVSKSQLLEAKNLGRASVPALVEALQKHVERIEMVRASVDMGFLESWKGLLQEQDPVRRMVFTRRAGLGGTSETLKSIGETLGVSRERVRQLENAVVDDLKQQRGWLSATERRIDDALKDDVKALDELAQDAWWKGIVALPTALDYFCETLLEREMRVIEVDERLYLARCSTATFEGIWGEVQRNAMQLPIPSSMASFQALTEKHVVEVGRFLAGVLYERLREMMHVEECEGKPQVVGFGTTKSKTVLAMLRASPTPLRVEEVVGRVGRFHVPDEVMYFDAGLIGLEQHFPDFSVWLDSLVPRCLEIMQRESPDRQWLTNEILEQLRETIELPEWLTPWYLAALLRRSARVHYLGRNRFMVLDSPEERGRIHYHDELTRILREHGEPMHRDDLIAELSKKTTARPATVAMFLARPPFIAVDAERIGLGERDVPGGAEAMAEALEHIARVLERRGRGLGAAQVQQELARLSQVHASWSMETCVSVLRGDRRFRLSQSGGVGLSHWEVIGVPSRTEIVRESLAQSEGRVTVETIQRRIEAYYGVAPERASVAQMANRYGAVLRGDWLERADISSRRS